MIKKRGRIHRGAIVLGSTFGSTTDLVQGLWRGGSEKRWLTPLAIFLCVTGITLTVAVTVEALAPFIYSIW